MAEFCSCGSIIIGGQCTNKSCKSRLTTNASAQSSPAKRASKSAGKTRKASKCITYRIEDLEKEKDKEE